jgi:hypothetical protein
MKWDSSPVLAAGIIAGFAALPQQALALNMGNLVYEPVEPCRIVDTRASTGGSLASGVPQPFLASGTGTELAPQGGDAAGCEHPRSAAGVSPVAISANVTAVGRQASANGYVVAYPTGSTAPTASLVNFTTAANIANSAIVGLCEGTSCTADFDLLANVTVPAIVDVQGYFYPQAGNVISVSPSGGDFATIVDAMTFLQGLTGDDAPAEGNAYIVEVGPGVYDGQVTMVPYVTIRGAGGSCGTTITYSAGGSQANNAAAVIMADPAALESVCIDATATGSVAWLGGIFVPQGAEAQVYDAIVTVNGSALANNIYGLQANGTSTLSLGLSWFDVTNAVAADWGVRALAGAVVSVATTELIGSPAVQFGGGAEQVAEDNQIRGGVTISGAEPRLINNLITGAVTDGDTGTTNCRANYNANLAPVGC